MLDFEEIHGIWKDGKEIYKSDKSNYYVRIGSITKIFTAICITNLIDEGKLNLTDSASKYVSLPDDITIEHLLTMKSGLSDYVNDETFISACVLNPEMEWDPKQLVAIALKSPMKFTPGEKFLYCNTNYIVLGLIIEVITAKNIGQVYFEYIFQKLQMDKTFLPPFEVLPDPCLKGINCHPSLAWSSGGIVSTLDDLYIFAQDLIKKDLSYLKKFGEYFGYDGNFPGFSTILLINPEKNIIIIVLTNLKQTVDGKSPANELAMKIIKDLD
jgi:D-alanyl-D-alanine carboxypeptidase